MGDAAPAPGTTYATLEELAESGGGEAAAEAAGEAAAEISLDDLVEYLEGHPFQIKQIDKETLLKLERSMLQKAVQQHSEYEGIFNAPADFDDATKGPEGHAPGDHGRFHLVCNPKWNETKQLNNYVTGEIGVPRKP